MTDTRTGVMPDARPETMPDARAGTMSDARPGNTTYAKAETATDTRPDAVASTNAGAMVDTNAGAMVGKAAEATADKSTGAITMTRDGVKLNVRVYPIDNPKGDTRAFANLAVNDKVGIRRIRVVEDAGGLFVTMPQSLDSKTGKYHDIAFPLSGDLRKDIIRAVLKEHDRVSVPLPPSLAPLPMLVKI